MKLNKEERKGAQALLEFACQVLDIPIPNKSDFISHTHYIESDELNAIKKTFNIDLRDCLINKKKMKEQKLKLKRGVVSDEFFSLRVYNDMGKGYYHHCYLPCHVKQDKK